MGRTGLSSSSHFKAAQHPNQQHGHSWLVFCKLTVKIRPESNRKAKFKQLAAVSLKRVWATAKKGVVAEEMSIDKELHGQSYSRILIVTGEWNSNRLD